MNPNRVSATLSKTDEEVVMTAVATIRQTLPFLIDLTTAERVEMPKLGPRTQIFVKRALEIGTQNSALLPVSFLEEMRKDARLFEALAPIQLAIDQLQKQIDDTVMQVGGEAYAAARTIYAVSKTPFAEAPLRAAAEDLGKRFGRKPRTAAPTEPPSSTPPPSSHTTGA